MAMKVATFNGCKVYNLSSGKTMPEWLSNTKKRALTKDEDYRKRLELIQDFEMTTASQCIKMTKDGEHIIVTGTYPPLVRCYTTSDMAMKFQRGLTCDVVAMETLSDDFGKLCFLQSDRTLSFHAPYGAHYSLRVPKFGRDIKYNWDNCDMYVAASGDEVYRLNLETGQFKEPFHLSYSGCNKVTMNPCHNLVACGGESSVCEFWDPRSRKAISKIIIDKSMATDVTALKFDTDGLSLAVGTSNGNCILYDIRSSVPIYTKEHQYGVPIVDVTFHNSSRHIISTDKKIVKIWERDGPNMGKILTNIETPADINNVLVVDDRRGQSGLIMLTGEQSRVMTYFVPQLGPAPRWCNFLESLTEELEETSGQSVYEDYKFLTKAEIDELGATGLIGTPMLKGYMHGFFIDMKLYNKLRAVSKPFEYEEHRKKKIRDKIEANRQSRIVATKRLPKVNKALAEKFLQSASKGGEKDGGEKQLVDDRFSSLFTRDEFQQDEEAIEYKLRNPSKGNNKRSGNGDDSDDDLADLYTPVEGMGSGNGRGDAGQSDDDDDDDEDDYSDVDSADEGDSLADNDRYDSDLDAISARKQGYNDSDDDSDSGLGNRKNKNKRARRSKDDSDDDEGQISKVSKKMEARAAAKKQSQQPPKRKFDTMFDNNASRIAAKEDHFNRKFDKLSVRKDKNNSMRSTSANNKAAAASGGGGPRMYEISDGASTAAAVFGHTEASRAQRKEEKELSVIQLAERLKANLAAGSKASLREKDKIRYVKTAEEGLVRELSYVPAEGRGVKRSADGLYDKGSKRSDGGRVEKFEGSNKSYMRSGGGGDSSSGRGGGGRGGGRGRGGGGGGGRGRSSGGGGRGRGGGGRR